jgi:hypothetical protein
MDTKKLLTQSTKEIPLGKSGLVALVDDFHYPMVSSLRWYPLRTKTSIYAQARMSGRNVLMHRILAKPTRKEHVDHINGVGIDNRSTNLRCCSRSQNLWNQKARRNNSSGSKGVSYCSTRKGKKRWVATIMANGKRTFLGYYESSLAAAGAYRAASKELHGEYSR